MEKLWFFELFSGDKGDNIDMRMIKITIKSNHIDMGVLLISKAGNIQKPCLSLKSGFSIRLLVCEFYAHGQTWYHSFISQPKKYKKKVVKRSPQYIWEYPFFDQCKESIRGLHDGLLLMSIQPVLK